MARALRSVALPAPWTAVLLPVSGFPLPTEERARLHREVQEVLGDLLAPTLTEHNVFLQLWNLGPQTGSAVLSRNVRQWNPEFGMGMWPNRGGPKGWTEESLMDAAASAMLGEEPDLPSHRVLRLSAPPALGAAAAEQMRGFGTLIETYSQRPFPEVAKRAREILLPTIEEDRFRDEPFYLPLFDQRTLEAVRSSEQLETWLCGIGCFVRDSGEDRAVLILTRTR
jgi:hypothetical protein